MNTSWYQDALSASLETSRWEHIPVVIFEQPKLAAERSIDAHRQTEQIAKEEAELVK